MSNETGRCPKCEETFTLTKAGVLRVHAERRQGAQWQGMNCPGSGQAPDLMGALKASLMEAVRREAPATAEALRDAVTADGSGT